MKVRQYILLVIYPFIFYSCCYTLQCQQVYLKPSFISFSSSELETVVFRKYQIQSNFRNLIDTMLIQPFTLPGTFTRNDTTFLFTNGIYPFSIESGYEYEIFVPATSTLAKVRDIQEEKSEQKICAALDRKQCYNEINHYKINDVSKSGEFLFIRK